MDNFITTK
jgi:(S)-2-hydroxy-acid oxidase